MKAWRQTPEGIAARAKDDAQKAARRNNFKKHKANGSNISSAAFDREVQKRLKAHTEKEHEKQGLHDALVAAMKSYESEKTTSSKPDGSTADVNALVLAKILGKA